MEAIERAATLIRQAQSLVIAAGAGMGVDSGLPDFRGNTGFWKAYPALEKAGLEFVSVASPRTFENNPALAWGFYGHRLALYRKTVPHPGFDLLQHWGSRMPGGLSVFTSNVDGQFQKAGLPENRINEHHGSIHHLQCLQDCGAGIWAADEFVPEVDEQNCLLLNHPPVCPDCGGIARPNILMFGDWKWKEERSLAQESMQESWLSTATKVVVIELGAGTAIPSVRHFSDRVVREHGGRLIRINPRESEVDDSLDVGLEMGALDALRKLESALGGEWRLKEPSFGPLKA